MQIYGLGYFKMQIGKCKLKKDILTFTFSNFDKAEGFLNAEQFSIENCSGFKFPITKLIINLYYFFIDKLCSNIKS